MQFLAGTWYEVETPENCTLDPEEIYALFWDGDLPEGIEVTEIELDHIWDDQLFADRPILARIDQMLAEDRELLGENMDNPWLCGRIEALAQLQREVAAMTS